MEELENIVFRLKTNYQPEKIILFGSYAEGVPTEESDLDILIIKDTDKNPWKRSEEIDRFMPPNIPLDILVYTPLEVAERLRMNDLFIREIIEKGRILYEK